ncbi:MAG: DUF6335 family protein [Oculatellaceae cyanobacterium Prado106]|jgi:hypothetical protein|nr:DUF6335 family protein [Oculatellaceae cyanobacterium Prado106]
MAEKTEPMFNNPTDTDDLEAMLRHFGDNIPEDDEDLYGDELDDPEGQDGEFLEEDFEEGSEEELGEDFEDLPQAVTESYGTGVQELPGYNVGGRTMQDRRSQLHEASPELTGGDIDANFEQANAVGDESVGGTVTTPDMDIVDDLGKAVGLEMADNNYLHTNEILEQRDSRRWELEPGSSEDYEERREGYE